MHPWTADLDVPIELASRLIASQFPELAGAEVAPFGEGWDNCVFLVRGTLIFRFPRREVAAPLLHTETKLLPFIAPRVPLSVPVAEFLGKPDTGYPWHFAGYSMLPGRTAVDRELSEPDREAMAEPLARFLRALHEIPAEEARLRGAPGDLIGRMDLAKRIPRGREILNELRPEIPGLERLFDGELMSYEPRADTLVHGDLYGRQMLVDDSKRLCGIIDWGDCHVGDRATDLVPVYTTLPPSARARFFAVYGRVDHLTERVAKARALYHTLNVLRYARDIGNNLLAREATKGLSHLAD